MRFHQFRFQPLFLRFGLAPRKPRHPLLRVLLGLLGIGLLLAMLVVGVFAGLAMLAFGALSRLRAQRPSATPTAAGDALQGDFRVVPKQALPSR